MTWSRLVLVTILMAGAPPGHLGAQSAQAVSLQVSGLFNGVFGGLFTGAGAEAQIRYTPGAFSVGAGFQYTSHELDGQREDASLLGGFIEPRYRIHAGSNVVAPYVAARFSLLKIGFSGGDLSLSSSVVLINGGGGVLVRLGSHVNADLGATYGYSRLGDGTLTEGSTGVQTPVRASSGTNLAVRLGLAFGLGD